jgi:hypothetical protein
VKEDSPNRLHYFFEKIVHEGHPRKVSVEILVCSDPGNEGAPLYAGRKYVRIRNRNSVDFRTEGVTELVKLTADLSRVPLPLFPIRTGKDDEQYYILNFQVEITYLSAYTKYELIHNDVNYGAVAAEYV